MTKTAASMLVDRARKLIEAAPADEERLYDVLRTLIDQHGYKKAALARLLGIGKQHLYRVLASRRDEWAPYRAMCGDHASVIEALHGMPAGVREQLRKQFERTGKTYSQVALRRLKRQLAAGENIAIGDVMAGMPISASSPRVRHRQSRSTRATAGQSDEQAWLRSLVAPVARAEHELLARLGVATPTASAPDGQQHGADSQHKRTPPPVIALTPVQARRLIRQLGGNADLPVDKLQGELARLAMR